MKERRRSKRKIVHIKARIELNENSYDGYIENISEQGIFLETATNDPLKIPENLSPGTSVYVKFKVPPEVKLELHCRIMWSYQVAPHGLTTNVGLEVIFPPPGYLEFYKELK